MFIAIFFWILVFLVFYTYFGYGLLIKAILLVRGKAPSYSIEKDADLPSLAMIIAAYNEEGVIMDKLVNTVALDYPSEKLRIIVITDGSNDKTAALVSGFPAILHLHLPERKGKVAAINRAVKYAGNAEILVFSDANTILNKEALKRLVVYYQNPLVGGVSGEKKVEQLAGSKVKGENLYWRYESGLKKLDADFHTVVGAAGELFSVRCSLYPEVPEQIILDDFYISLKVCEKKYLVKYEPDAFATEKPSFSMKDEKTRKIRISAGAFQAMTYFQELMNPFKYGKLSFQFLSRRVFRWVICPLALPLILICNIFLVASKINPLILYQIILFLQISFYLLAISGWLLEEKKAGKRKIFYVPYYFSFMNLSVWAGFFRYINGRQSAIWEKANRAS
jgi:cellulose synthase/poly-beta-1,6-N-acetylglucosamine synthase-like glycosyltransferase